MCLDVKGFRLVDNTKGEGWKIVRITARKDVFLPYWPAFHADGNGGVYYLGDDPDLIKCDIHYTIGKPTTVKHKRTALLIGADECSPIRIYLAAIHLYKSLYGVAAFWAEMDRTSRARCVVIKCRYSQGICEDYRCVVARRIVPCFVEEGELYGRV